MGKRDLVTSHRETKNGEQHAIKTARRACCTPKACYGSKLVGFEPGGQGSVFTSSLDRLEPSPNQSQAKPKESSLSEEVEVSEVRVRTLHTKGSSTPASHGSPITHPTTPPPSPQTAPPSPSGPHPGAEAAPCGRVGFLREGRFLNQLMY